MKLNTQLILIHGALVFGVLLNYASAEPATEIFSQHTFCKSQLGGEFLARTELFFGLSKPNGSIVTEQDFQLFVDREITPHFPQGLTLLAGYGQFLDKKGTLVKENAKLLILLYPFNKDRNKSIEEIRRAYLKMFQQEAVLRVDGQSCVSF